MNSKFPFFIGLILSLFTAHPLLAQPENLVRGLYVSFEDFQSNNPLGTDKFYLSTSPRKSQQWLGTESISVHLDESNRKVFNVWGFCDGTGQYIQMDKDFFKLEFANDTISFYGFGRPEDEDLGAVSNLAGTVGNATAASNARAEAKTKRVRYMLDPATGTVLKYPTPIKLQTTVIENPVLNIIVYRELKREKDSLLLVKIEDSEPIALVPASVYRASYPPSAIDSIHLCYGPSFNQCLKVERTAATTVYVLATLPDRTGEAKLERVPTSQGEWDSEIARTLQSKREAEDQ